MRFVLFDRIEELRKGEGAVLIKNISQCEDYFIDHFPGYPVVPGSIILGSFEQGSEILLGASFDFTRRPVLRRLSRVSLRHFVVPGDQLRIDLQMEPKAPECIKAQGWVANKKVAEGRLEFDLIDTSDNIEAQSACDRLKGVYDLFTASPVGKVWGLWATQSSKGEFGVP